MTHNPPPNPVARGIINALLITAAAVIAIAAAIGLAAALAG